MEEKKIKRKVVPITTFYKPANYKDIAPGSVLLGIGAGKLWRAIDSTEDYLQVADAALYASKEKSGAGAITLRKLPKSGGKK